MVMLMLMIKTTTIKTTTMTTTPKRKKRQQLLQLFVFKEEQIISNRWGTTWFCYGGFWRFGCPSCGSFCGIYAKNKTIIFKEKIICRKKLQNLFVILGIFLELMLLSAHLKRFIGLMYAGFYWQIILFCPPSITSCFNT